MIKTIALVIVLAVGALLIYAATRPDVFRVERSATIAASPDKIQPLINDMQRFNGWNPYAKKDPAMKGTYRGPAAGPGAAFDFDGDKNVGKGSLQIVEPTGPGRVSMKLDMTAPMEAHNLIDFTLAPQAGGTQVTWSMQGPMPFMGKLMGVIFNMDKMVGKDMESGLASLKALAEKP
ncbi:MAG: SRPBCC family protein [Rhizobacter sp.]|nr:SRPBCC family protein [Rhizobacter sp.]